MIIDESAVRERFAAVSPHLDERGRRTFAAAEAKTAGYGGISAVWRATGIAASTIGRGLNATAAAMPSRTGCLKVPRYEGRSGGSRRAAATRRVSQQIRRWRFTRPLQARRLTGFTGFYFDRGLHRPNITSCHEARPTGGRRT